MIRCYLMWLYIQAIALQADNWEGSRAGLLATFLSIDSGIESLRNVHARWWLAVLFPLSSSASDS